MSVVRIEPMTMAEFLEWEEHQDAKYEFDGFAPVAMVGVARAHSSIQRNVMLALGTRLRGKECKPHGGELKIEAAGRIRYPDAFVVCTPGAGTDKVITDPVVIFEILSEGSDHRDRVSKNEEYRRTPSVQRYVILEQFERGGVFFARVRQREAEDKARITALRQAASAGVDDFAAGRYRGFADGEALRGHLTARAAKVLTPSPE